MLLLLACSSSRIVPLDRGATPPEDAPLETVPAVEDDGCPSIYAQEILPEFELLLTDEAWAGLQSDYASGVKEYHDATFVHGDTVIDTAAVRLRGNPGFSWLGEKMQFAISFNERDPDGRFEGLRKLSLDASWYDPSLMRDRVAYAMLREAGVPASCANHARLVINGELYGIYKNVEFVDQEFLERVFGDESAGGALWKYGYTVTANEEAANASLVSAYWADPSVAAQEQWSDLGANVTEWAAEAMVVQNDGYWCCSHNFYLYEHPEAGLAFLPWDLDFSLDSAPYWADPYTWYRDSNGQSHFDAVVADPVWGPRFLDSLRDVSASVDVDAVVARTEQWEAQIQESVAEDPHTNVSPGAFADANRNLRWFVDARRAFVESWLDCQEGVTSDADGDGYAPCDDCDVSDPDVHPGAAEACDGRDDDCNGLTDDDAACDTCEELSFGDSRLLICPQMRTWEEAREVCAAHGGDLGFPRITEDWYVFWIRVYWHETAWAGITDWWAGATDVASEGTWLGVDGTAVAPGWAGGQPSGGTAENCAAVQPGTWTWGDRDCGERLPAVCRLE